MILNELPKSIIFDDIGKSEGQVFLSTLDFLFENPQHICLKRPKIITTSTLAKRFMLYMRSNNVFYKHKNFHIIQPFVPFTVRVPDSQNHLEVLACETQDTSRNLVYLIKQDGFVTHCYGGISGDIRSILLNDVFFSWVSLGVDYLYLNLRRHKESMNSLVNEYRKQQITKLIDVILLKEPIGEPQVDIIVPAIGCENLIAYLFENYKNNVAIDELLEKLYFDEKITSERNSKHARIKIKCNNKDFQLDISNPNQHILKITQNYKPEVVVDCERYYELCYSPYPTPFELKFLVSTVSPSNIYGIPTYARIKVPHYLDSLCSKYKEKKAAVVPVKQSGATSSGFKSSKRLADTTTKTADEPPTASAPPLSFYMKKRTTKRFRMCYEADSEDSGSGIV